MRAWGESDDHAANQAVPVSVVPDKTPKKRDGDPHKRRHKIPVESGEAPRGEEREHRRHGHSHHHGREHGGDRERNERVNERPMSGVANALKNASSMKASRSSEHTEHRDRGDYRSERGDRREREPHSQSRPVQIVQRPGATKILGSERRGGDGIDSTRGIAATAAASVEQSQTSPNGPSSKKKQSFAVPTATASFSKCRLMDEDWRVCVEAVQSHLFDSVEFTAVACVGPQGSGKSLVLSLLIASIRGALGKGTDSGVVATGGPSPPLPVNTSPTSPILNYSAPPPPPPTRDAEVDRNFETPLEIHTLQDFMDGRSSPPGVDLCVSTLDRLLLMDVQPLFEYEKVCDNEIMAEYHLSLFLSSICHTLLVVTDVPADVQLFKFLRLLATFKLQMPDFATWVERHRDGTERLEKQHHYPAKEALPRLVVAFNNIGYDEMDDDELYAPAQSFLKNSPWKDAPSVNFVRIPPLAGSSLSSLLRSESAHSAGIQLRERVLAGGPGRGKFGGKDGLQFTESDWLDNICGYWDYLQNCRVVKEYFNLAAHGLDSYSWPGA